MQRLTGKNTCCDYLIGCKQWRMENGCSNCNLSAHLQRLWEYENILFAPDGTERVTIDRLRGVAEAEASGTDALEAAHNELRQVREQLAAEQVTSQSLRNAANGYKLELDAERKKANDARNELCLKCGRYHEAHNGACDGCRWGEEEQSEGSDT